MPFLQPARKGRIRKDAVLQTFIYNYQSAVPDEQVVAGLKCELVRIPLMMPTVEQAGLGLPVPHKCSLGSVMLVKSSVFVA